MHTVAFIGLGTMGGPMTGHLQAKGMDVRAWSRSPESRQRWGKRFGEQALKPEVSQAVASRAIVCMCLGNDDDVASVALGASGVVALMEPGAILVDHTTTSAKMALLLGEACHERGIGFVDAPVSGGQKGAEEGILTIMCGGDQETYEKIKPVLDCYARKHDLMGEIGAGQKTKMVNQICIAGLVQALSEGIKFGEKAGLNVAQVIDVISKGAAQSWQMENRANTMHERSFDFGFNVNWMIKDLKYALEEAQRNASDAPITQTVLSYYQELANAGHGKKDTSSLLLRLDRDK